MTLKIVHTADIHLDSPLSTLAMRHAGLRDRVGTASRMALERIVSACIDEGAAALLISGDLYDRAERSVQTAAYFAGQMQRLRDRNIQAFYIKGNHDAENPVSGEIALPDNVHVFDGRGGKVRLEGTDVWIHGVSFAGSKASESLLGHFRSPEPRAVNIAMLHTSLAGAAGHDVYAPCSVSDLSAMGFDYWALGHVHKRQVHAERPWIVMPGSPQGRDIGEAGPKSATLLDMDGGAISIRELSTACLQFRQVHLDVSEVDNEPDLERRIDPFLLEQKAGDDCDLALRVTMHGETPLAWRIRRDQGYWLELFEQRAADIGSIWIDRLVIDVTEPARLDTSGTTADPVDELASMMATLMADEGVRTAARANADAILDLLPRERRDLLAADEQARDRLVERLLSEARDDIVARLRGAGAAA